MHTDTIDQIRDLTKVGLNPKHIHAAILQNNPQSIITQQDVYNQRLYHRGEYLNGRTPLEALLDELNEGWVTQYMQVDGRLRSLFFASQEQVELMMLPGHCTYGFHVQVQQIQHAFAPLRWCHSE